MDFSSFEELFSYVESQFTTILEEDVFPVVESLISENVQIYVYDVYDPVKYQRTGQLKRDIVYELVDDSTIDIWNDTFQDGVHPNRKNVYIPEIVEYGEWSDTIGYEFLPRPMDASVWTYLAPRPFMYITVTQLQMHGYHVEAFAKGLQKFTDVEIL